MIWLLQEGKILILQFMWLSLHLRVLTLKSLNELERFLIITVFNIIIITYMHVDVFSSDIEG